MSLYEHIVKYILSVSCKCTFSVAAFVISWNYGTEILFRSGSFAVAQTQSQPRGSGRTITRAERDDCPRLPKGTPTLTALTSKSSFTATLSQSPTFRFYTPYAKGKYQFRLRESRKSKTLLYREDIARNDQAGIFTVSLPKIPAMKPRTNYLWELEYFCSDKPKSDSLIVFDWVYQDQLTQLQMSELREAKNSSDRIAFYRKYGIWLDLLDEIAKSLPQSQTLWQQVLEAEGLQSISKKTLLSTK